MKYTDDDAEKAEIVLDKFHRAKLRVAAILYDMLEDIVDHKTLVSDCPGVMEAIDDLTYEARKLAEKVIEEHGAYETQRHEFHEDPRYVEMVGGWRACR